MRRRGEVMMVMVVLMMVMTRANAMAACVLTEVTAALQARSQLSQLPLGFPLMHSPLRTWLPKSSCSSGGKLLLRRLGTDTCEYSRV